MRLRNIVTYTLAILGAVGVKASEKVYTYAGDARLVTHSTYRAETVSLAMLMDNPTLKGKKITKLKAKIDPAAQTLTDCKLWLSSALTLVKNEAGKKVNVPDILSVPVTPDAEGWMEVTLPTPYTLNGKSVFVGYSFTVADYNAEGGRPIVYSQDRHPQGFYMHGTTSSTKWMDYADRLLGVLPIYVTVDGDFATDEVSPLEWDTAYPYAQQGRGFSLPLFVYNTGDNAVESLEYAYSINGKSGQGELKLGAPITPDISRPTPLLLTFAPIADLGAHTMELCITGVNGKGNGALSPEVNLPVECRTLVPQQRVLMEEGTGTWCTACVRGIAAIKALRAQYGDLFVAVAYHQGNDPMYTAAPTPWQFSSLPSATLNRNGEIDPYYGDDHTQRQHYAIQPLVDAALRKPAVAGIEVASRWTDPSKTSVEATATLDFVNIPADGEYSVEFMVTADGLKGDIPQWWQYNGLSHSDPSTMHEVLLSWAEAGSPIRDIEFEDVHLTGDTPGCGTTLSSQSHQSVNRSLSLEGAKSAFSVTQGEYLVQDPDKLHVVALLLHKDGHVANVVAAPVGTDSSTAGIESDACISLWRYNLQGLPVSEDTHGLCIEVLTDAHGIKSARKAVR